jgi:EAL domain-containing protein (putative c-di-GMP-specific phosphodiesterase class I)
LELEITESLMMGDTHNATKVLKEIKARGFDIAMDDFGTGYSSLAYLKRFPIDTIKIDRTFVRDIATDEGDAAIIDAILAIARQLKLKSVAEGIETEEQLSLLLTKECEIGQGYLFSKPVPADEMAALLKKAIL